MTFVTASRMLSDSPGDNEAASDQAGFFSLFKVNGFIKQIPQQKLIQKEGLVTLAKQEEAWAQPTWSCLSLVPSPATKGTNR